MPDAADQRVRGGFLASQTGCPQHGVRAPEVNREFEAS